MTEVLSEVEMEKMIEKTILVNAGFNTVGQAVISISLAQGYTVYTTVENEEQAKLLKKRFPSVKMFFFFVQKYNNKCSLNKNKVNNFNFYNIICFTLVTRIKNFQLQKYWIWNTTQNGYQGKRRIGCIKLSEWTLVLCIP